MFGFYLVQADYRVERIQGFFSSEKDVLGSGYQVDQSKLALGSGGLVGAGLGQSTQKLNFLPFAHTDFIFAILGEETGLLGTLFTLGLYLFFLWRGLKISLAAPTPTFKMIAAGVTLAIVAQALMNMSIVLGLGPAKGTPLPLLSYGRSSLICTLAGDRPAPPHQPETRGNGRNSEDMRRPRVIISGGGTGGHLYPALVVGRRLIAQDPAIALTYVGTRRDVEGRIMAEHGVTFIPMRIEGLKGRGLKSLRGLIVLPLAFAHSLLILLRTRPALVIGVGGYSSGPIVLLASWLRIPTVILEQNARPGFTNRAARPLRATGRRGLPFDPAALQRQGRRPRQSGPRGVLRPAGEETRPGARRPRLRREPGLARPQ